MPISCRRFILALVVLTSISLSAIAAPQKKTWPPIVQQFADRGLTIVKSFDAPNGLKGFAAKAGSNRLTLYVTPDGKHVIIGPLFDAQGHDLSAKKLRSIFGPSDNKSAWQRLAQSNWIADGSSDAKRIVYEFTDPNCPYCQRFYKKARPWIKAGKVQIRHIPVAMLKPSSIGKAAAMLGADDPAAAMARNENTFKSGGIKPVAKVPKRLYKQIAANTQLMHDMRIRGTPGIVYRDDNGEVSIASGLPTDKGIKQIMGPK